MKRYLVVANRTLGGHELLDRVRDALDGGPCHSTRRRARRRPQLDELLT